MKHVLFALAFAGCGGGATAKEPWVGPGAGVGYHPTPGHNLSLDVAYRSEEVRRRVDSLGYHARVPDAVGCMTNNLRGSGWIVNEEFGVDWRFSYEYWHEYRREEPITPLKEFTIELARGLEPTGTGRDWTWSLSGGGTLDCWNLHGGSVFVDHNCPVGPGDGGGFCWSNVECDGGGPQLTGDTDAPESFVLHAAFYDCDPYPAGS